jgi:hypothetical protein
MTILLFLAMCAGAAPALTETKAAGGGVSDQVVPAIAQAIEDEIYDYGYEKKYVNIGTTGAIDSPTDVAVYIVWDQSQERGGVVYKFMPFGEVQRRVALRADGLAVLSGKPHNGFPATQPDTNTLYLQDEQVCEFKQRARRAVFTVDPDVSKVRRESAARRQQLRVGYSQWLGRRTI